MSIRMYRYNRYILPLAISLLSVMCYNVVCRADRIPDKLIGTWRGTTRCIACADTSHVFITVTVHFDARVDMRLGGAVLESAVVSKDSNALKRWLSLDFKRKDKYVIRGVFHGEVLPGVTLDKRRMFFIFSIEDDSLDGSMNVQRNSDDRIPAPFIRDCILNRTARQ